MGLGIRLGRMVARGWSALRGGIRAAVSVVWQNLPASWIWGSTNPSTNSIVIAVVHWLQRQFDEAPPILQEWSSELRTWEDNASPLGGMRTRVLRVLQNPNDLYGGMALWDATVADFTITGNAFWRKLRNDIGAVGGLEWLPSTVVTPRSDTTGVPLEYWEVQTARGPVLVPPSEMVHFRKGIDPSNPALGISPLRSLLREIETDEVAAAMTTALMRNFGVPGIVVIPETGEITPDVAEKAARDFQEQHSGENVGRPLFLRRKATVQVIGHSPRDLRLDELRGVPEERISATMGVNAAVLGLGRGLAAQKVGATLREYIQQAIKGTLSPMWDVMAEAITRQLLPDFGLNERWRLTFDRKRGRGSPRGSARAPDLGRLACPRRDADPPPGPQDDGAGG